MNFSSVAGFAMAAATVWFAVINDSPNPAMLLNIKAVALVLGGSLAAGLVIYPISQLVELAAFVWFGLILKRRPNKSQMVKELVSAASIPKREQHLLPIVPASHPFMVEGFKLISEGQLSEHDLRDILTRRSQYFKTAYMSDAKMLAALGKFPSSFGMLGSTVGLIDMMSELGEKGSAGIGPAMAMALVATFWGLVFTYMVFMPMSDYAVRLAGEDNLIRQLIIEGLLMVKRNEDPHLALEKLNGFLALNDRLVIAQGKVDDKYWEEIQEEITKIRQMG